jgi:outer membrane phospholipase A
VDLTDDEPEIVKYMIQYLYELDYHIPSEQSKGLWALQMNW